MANLKSRRFAMRLELETNNGTANYDCLSFSATFALNTMPTANVALAVGRVLKQGYYGNVPTGSRPDLSQVGRTPSLGSAGFPSDSYLQRGVVKLESIGNSEWAGLPSNKELKAFDGYVNGPSASIDERTGRLALSMTHWLLGLNFTSTIDGVSHSPSPFSERVPIVTNSDGKAISFVAFLSAALDTELKAAQGDLWGSGLLEFIKYFAENINTTKRILCPLNPDVKFQTSQAELQATYARLKASTQIPGYRPLSLSSVPDFNVRSLLATKFGKFVSDELSKHSRAMTLWDALVLQLIPQMQAALVPTIDHAFAAPLVLGYGADDDVSLMTIKADDIIGIQFSAQSLRPVGGVEVLNMLGNNSGAPGNDQQIAVGGCYFPDSDAKGTLMSRYAPRWFGSLVPAPSAGKSKLNGNRQNATSENSAPGEGDAKGSLRSGQTAADSAAGVRDVYSQLAQTYFYEEALRGRYARIVTNFRLDISPGMVLRVEIPERGKATDSLVLIGTVLQVSIALDAEQAAGGTVIELSSYRYVGTNDLPPIDRHPFYGAAYTGTPLTTL